MLRLHQKHYSAELLADAVRPAQWNNDGRFPLWDANGVELLLRTGMPDGLTDFNAKAAVILTPQEQRIVGIAGTNHFFMRVGRPRELSSNWMDFYIEIGRVYQFSAEHDWGRQRLGFEQLCRGFFEGACTRAHLGWVSLITMQRPQVLRNWEDSRIKIVTNDVRLGKSQAIRDSLQLANLHSQPASGFCFKACPGNHAARLRQVEVHRRLRSPAFLQQGGKILIERRYVPAVDGEDDHILKAARIPSLVKAGAAKVAQLGTNGYLNLAMVTLKRDGRCLLLNNTLEISPESGRIVTIRTFESTLDAAMLSASVVEHVTLCEAIRSRLGIKDLLE